MYVEGFEPFSGAFLEREGLKDMGRKVLEEAHEAASEMEGVHRGGESRYPALLELADVCQAVENALAVLGAGRGEWEGAVADVRRKNLLRGRYGDRGSDVKKA